ncbi:MAG TPA: helix-turn-helix domain-containing protein [Candidatus Kapabacteria bacterium]|nr:helix-turn-helix domain-containing protein [Candidatus Kapabacteria bacterium]
MTIIPDSTSVSLVNKLVPESVVNTSTQSTTIEPLPESLPDEIIVLSLPQIAEIVANIFKIEVSIMTQRNRDLEIIVPRYFFCKVASYYGYTCTAIGEFLGQDHATVLNAIKKMNIMLDKYVKLERAYDRVTLFLGNVKVSRVHKRKISKLDNIVQNLDLNE